MSEFKLDDEQMKTLELIRKNGFSIYENFDTNKRREFDIERFREKKQPEDFHIPQTAIKMKWREQSNVYEFAHAGGNKIDIMSPKMIRDTFFEMVRATKGTDFECQQTNDIAKQIEVLFKEHFGIEIFPLVRKRLYKIIESGGK